MAYEEVIAATGGEPRADGAAKPLCIIMVVYQPDTGVIGVAADQLIGAMPHHQNDPVTQHQGIFETLIKNRALAIR